MPISKKLKKLKARRQGFRLSAGNQLRDVEPYIKQDADWTVLSQERLQLIVETLQHHQSELEDLNSQILDEIPEDDDDSINKEAEESHALHESIFYAITSADLVLKRLGQRQHVTDDLSVMAGSISVDSQYSQVHRASVRLPTLEIKPFDGNPLKWQEFWDGFKTTIHDNPGLADIDKYTYLKGYLDKEALQVIDGYRLTSNNYPVVIEALRERFGDPECAIFAHFEQLLALPTSGNFSDKLRVVYDECEKHIRSLVALGLSEDMFGKVFTPIILSKLPQNVRIQLHRINGSIPWKLSRLRELLRDEIKARDMSERYSTKPNSNQSNQNKHQKQRYEQKSKQVQSTQGMLVNASKSKGGKLNLNCCFCNANHYAEACTQFKTSDERRSQLNGKCFKCLGSNHLSKECRKQTTCYFCKKNSHYSSLCNAKFGKDTNATHTSTKDSSKVTPAAKDSSMLQSGNNVMMQMAQVTFQVNGEVISVHILFDTGSSRSYITSRLSNLLKLETQGQEIISAAQFGRKRRKNLTYNQAEIKIPTKTDDFVPVAVLVTDQITCPLQKYPLDASSNSKLAEVQLADSLCQEIQNVSIDILVGADHYYDFVGSECISLGTGIYLLNSKLGYIATGKLQNQEYGNIKDVNLLCQSCDVQRIQFDAERLWSLEEIGVKDDPSVCDDDKAIEDFNTTIKFNNGRYEVTWPWKDRNFNLPTNYCLALGRLKLLISRIGTQEKVIKQYQKTIDDQLEKGIIEEVKNPHEGDKIHYIPHHCVIREDKVTTKLRIVYDASAKSTKMAPSLNECLLRGPVILQDLCGMIMRFRLSKVALISDVEKAFLQVGIQSHERDVTRFLWIKDSTKPPIGSNLIVYRFCRVPFSVISSPFLLSATIKHHCGVVNTPDSNDS